VTDLRDLAPPEGGELVRMLPAAAYTSEEVLAWERRHLYAGGWSCLGRVADLFPAGDALTQRAVVAGDVSCLVVRDGAELRMFANTCRHRGHELLPDGGTSSKRSVTCPYHAWNYDLSGQLKGAPGFRDVEAFAFEAFGLVELPLEVWNGWVFGHAVHPVGAAEVPSFDR
jgi:Rieske 2Fe-2S family protein